MKRFSRLCKEEKERAIQVARNRLLQWMTDGCFFGDELQQRIDAAFAKANEMRTPWFTHEYILDDPVLRNYIEDRAKEDVKSAYYPEPWDSILSIEWKYRGD